MKSILVLIMLFVACLTGCAQSFTRTNAATLGAQLARSSLEVAARYIAGERMDLRHEAALIGLQTSSNAIALVTYNLQAPADVTPQAVVSAAGDVAAQRIAAAAVPDVAIAAKAREIAASAVTIADRRLAEAGAVAAP